ncbi:hypothetical protein BBP40_004793 [Aspergillus hancockii]|nr:hypothetical protein BBP40_004793 [Aspergillus hancockii]
MIFDDSEMSDTSDSPNASERGAMAFSDETPMHYAPAGSICEVYNLYQTKPDRRGRSSWTKDLPVDLTSPAEDSESSQFALVVRNEKCYSGRKNLEIHSILVQSEPLKKFLGDVQKGYPRRHNDARAGRVQSSFQAISKAPINLLYRVLEEELRDTIARKKDLVHNGVITHDLLWCIFEPEDTVYCGKGGRERAFEFASGETNCQRGAFQTSSSYVDFDGKAFGFRSAQHDIPLFQGTLPITALSIFPLKYHSEEATVRENLSARGKVWEAFKGYHYKHRIIIDADAYTTFNPDMSIRVDSPIPVLDDEKRLLATPKVRVYSLRDKKWLEFYLEGIEEIVWDSQAFDSLVLPDEQHHLKHLVLAVAKADWMSLTMW